MEIRATCKMEAIQGLPNTTVYVGERTNGNAEVWAIRAGVKRKLPLRLDVWNHSPTGFEWGYGGSGPAQLALALLIDVLRDHDYCCELHQPFKWEVVSKWSGPTWRITADEISAWAHKHDQLIEDSRHAKEREERPATAEGGGA